MRFVFVALILTSLNASAEIPTHEYIVALADRGADRYGHGRNLTLMSLGFPAPVTSNNVFDYVNAVQRYSELIEKGRKQQLEASSAKAEGDSVRDELEKAQTENQRALADAQRRHQELSRDQLANPDEIKTLSTAMENEIAERSRANYDYENQVSRLKQNEADLSEKLKAMDATIRSAEMARETAARSLADRGFNEDGSAKAGGGSAAAEGNMTVGDTARGRDTAPGSGGQIVIGEAHGINEAYHSTEPMPNGTLSSSLERTGLPNTARAYDAPVPQPKLPTMADIVRTIKATEELMANRRAMDAAPIPRVQAKVPVFSASTPGPSASAVHSAQPVVRKAQPLSNTQIRNIAMKMAVRAKDLTAVRQRSDSRMPASAR